MRISGYLYIDLHFFLEQHPMAGFRPTRAHSFLVFNKIDVDMSGKITLSEFQESALSVGFTWEQASNLFNR